MTAPTSPLRRLAAAALLPLLCLAAAPAVPQTPAAGNRYTVELVVFRNGGTGAALAATDAASPPGSSEIATTATTSRKLGGAVSRLRSAGGYRVLGHASWTQGPAAWNSRRGPSATQLGLGAGIEGKVVFERGQYLHLGVDLTVDDGGRRYRINEVRRVKVDEVNYFDHPSIGVIAVVSAGG